MAVRLPAGTVRSFPVAHVYELTGKERLPLTEKLPDLRTVPLSQKREALTMAGGQLEVKITAQTELETPELAASLAELSLRATKAGDQWPNPRLVVVNPVEAGLALGFWQTAPGSPDSQRALAELKKELQPVLDRPDEEASVCWPLCSNGHWTWLNFRRPAKPPSQAEPNKWEAVYRDSLSAPSVLCRDHAVSAYSMAVQLFGAGSLASLNLPPVQRDTVQSDGTSCGFHCINWTEQEYRRIRGEGQYRLPEKFTQKAEDLSKFFKTVMAAKPKPAQPKPAQSAEPAPPLPPPLQPPPAQAPLPLAGPPASQSGSFGCSRCRWSPAGCLSCNGEKALKAGNKAAAKNAVSKAIPETRLSALDSLALPDEKRHRQDE